MQSDGPAHVLVTRRKGRRATADGPSSGPALATAARWGVFAVRGYSSVICRAGAPLLSVAAVVATAVRRPSTAALAVMTAAAEVSPVIAMTAETQQCPARWTQRDDLAQCPPQ